MELLRAMREKEKRREQIKNWIDQKIKGRGLSYLSKILHEAKELYVEEMGKHVKDVEQSWKAFKGNLLEEIIFNAIKEQIEELGFKIVKGNEIEKNEESLEECLCKVKRSVLVDYGEFGMHLPDIDLIIYYPDNCQALAIISLKVTLRERIAQTGYWKLKLKSSPITKDVKVFFITLDEDGDFRTKNPAKKSRAIAEVDTDGVFLITSSYFEKSEKVKKIEEFLEIIRELKKTY